MEVFYIAAPRLDGKPPSPVKALHERFFLLIEEAKEAKAAWEAELGFPLVVVQAVLSPTAVHT